MKIKSIFLILFLIPSLAMADYYFTVENTTMVDTYFNIFNAIASLFKNDSYIELLRLIFLLGGFFVFAGGVLSAWETGGSGKVLAPYAKYTLVGVALLTFMFSQKENMWVTTNNIPSFCSTGSHTTGTAVQMPAVLAYFFSVTNRLGTSLTYMAESAFNTPNANGTAAMSDSNGYLGSLKETLRLLSFNPNQVTFSTGLGAHMQYGHIDFLSMWQNFFAKCVYDVAQNKGITGDNVINGLVASNNIPLWLDNYMGTNPFSAESPGYPPSENLIVINGEHTTCGTYYQFLKDNVNPKLTDNYACAFPFTNAGVLELITGNSGGIVSELNGIALQSGLINALGSSKIMTSIGISGADFASGKSRAESNQENLATAQYMAQMLPYLQMTMRAVLYAFFPFVFITVLLPGGLKVLGQYAQTLIWIELWGPTAAIVNMFVNMQVKAEVATKYNEIGLTYMSSIDMLGEANTIAGVGAMLYLSIPALTWLIISGSGQMLGNLASGVSGKFSKNLESASVAQDMANIQKQQEVNARRQAEGMKALSYGEQMHYEANMKGMKEAGSMIAAMNTGLRAVGNAAQLSEESSTRSAVEKIAAAGGSITDASMVTAAKDGFDFAKTRETMGGLGIIGADGRVNMEKLNEFAKTDAGKDIINTLSNNKEYKKWAEEKKLDLNSRETLAKYMDSYSKTKSTTGVTQQITEDLTQEKTGQNNLGGSTRVADINSEEVKVKLNADEIIQKNLNSNDRSLQNAIKNIYDHSKTKEQFLSKVSEGIRQGTIDGKMANWDNFATELYQEKVSKTTHGVGKSNQNAVNTTTEERKANEYSIQEQSDAKIQEEFSKIDENLNRFYKGNERDLNNNTSKEDVKNLIQQVNSKTLSENPSNGLLNEKKFTTGNQASIAKNLNREMDNLGVVSGITVSKDGIQEIINSSKDIINRSDKNLVELRSKAEKDDAYIQTYNMAVKSNAELKKNQLELMNKMSNDGFIKVGKDKNGNATYAAQDVIKDMSNEEKTQLIGQINSRTSNLKATLAGAKSEQISNALGDLAFNTKSIRTGQEVASIDTYSSLALGGGETNNRKIFFAQQLEQITKQAASSLIIGGVTKIPGGKPPMPPSITNVTNVTNVTQTVPRNISGRF